MTDAEGTRIVVQHVIPCIIIFIITWAAMIYYRDSTRRCATAALTGGGLCFLVLAHGVLVAAGVL